MKLPLNIAVFIALLFHISGAIGILFTPYKDWFVQHTPLNLLLMALLIVATQSNRNKYFFLFGLIAFLTGMIAEIIGVNTSLLFGTYQYGKVMGWQIAGVPLLIGVNWWITVLSCGTITQQLYQWTLQKYLQANILPNARLMSFSIIFDGAFLATYFDYVMEPVAQKLGFWQWENSRIPIFNYLCWYVISCLLLMAFKQLPFNKRNHFALHLLIIQLLFFIALRLYL